MLHLCPNPARRYPTLPDERTLHDANLSLTAVGLLTRLMNTPGEGSTDPVTLSARWGTSRDAVNNAMRELTTAGLLLRTTVRLAGGHLHTVTLVCDDPSMLLTELSRLNTGGIVDGISQPAHTLGMGQRRHRPRHARPSAAAAALRVAEEGPVSKSSGPDRTHQGAGEHGEDYHHCVLRTTHLYIKPQASRAVAGRHGSARSASIRLDDRKRA